MDTKTPITRRTALALTALATLVGRKADASPQASAVLRLSHDLKNQVRDPKEATSAFSVANKHFFV